MSATLLIVDDEPLVRWSLRERFAQEGHTVVEAGTAAEAIEHAGSETDVVLLDCRLPDGDGLGVLRRLLALWPDTPVILMTAHSAVENAAEAMKQGAYHYIDKPFDLDDVVATVAKAVETSRLRRELRAYRNGRPSEGRSAPIQSATAPVV